MKKITYGFFCEKCGYTQPCSSETDIESVGKNHSCNPVLYNLVRKLLLSGPGGLTHSPENGSLLEEKLGIGCELAESILDEMEEKDLIEPFVGIL